MPRDSSGNYTLPSGNPVITGTLIESTWANPTMDDIGQALSDSLDRFGRGAMQAPLPFTDGSISQPAITWGNEPSMGLYRATNQDMRLVVGGLDRMRWLSDPTRPQVYDEGVWKPIALGGDLPDGVVTDTGDYTISGTWVFEGAASGPRFNQGVSLGNNISLAGWNVANSGLITIGLVDTNNYVALGSGGTVNNLRSAPGELRYNNALLNEPLGLVQVAANGYIPDDIINITSGLTYIGPWDASTGQNPTEAGEGPFTGGEWYNIAVAGTINLINPTTGLESPVTVEVGDAIVYGIDPAGWYRLSFGETPPPDLSSYTQRNVAESISAAWRFLTTSTRFAPTITSGVAEINVGNNALAGESRFRLQNLNSTTGIDVLLASDGDYGFYDRNATPTSRWALQLQPDLSVALLYGNRIIRNAPETITAAWTFDTSPTTRSATLTVPTLYQTGAATVASEQQAIRLLRAGSTMSAVWESLNNDVLKYNAGNNPVANAPIQMNVTSGLFFSNGVALPRKDQAETVSGLWTYSSNPTLNNNVYWQAKSAANIERTIFGVTAADNTLVGNTNFNLEFRSTPDTLIFNTSPLNTAKGLAQVGAGGKLPPSLLPFSALAFQGTFDASGGTNPPNGVDPGEFYVINVAGTLTVFINDTGTPVAQAVEPGDYLLWLETPNAPATGWYWIRRETPTFVAAEDVTYDNSSSRWTNTIVQDVLDEISTRAALKSDAEIITSAWRFNATTTLANDIYLVGNNSTSGAARLVGVDASNQVNVASDNNNTIVRAFNSIAFSVQGTNRLTLGTTASTNVPWSFSSTATFSSATTIFGSNAGQVTLRQAVDTTSLVLAGGVTNPAKIALYGATAASNPGTAFYDGVSHNFRGQGATPTFLSLRATSATFTAPIVANGTSRFNAAITLSTPGSQIKIEDTDDGDSRNNLVERNGGSFNLYYQDAAAAFTNFFKYTDSGTMTFAPGGVTNFAINSGAGTVNVPWTFSASTRTAGLTIDGVAPNTNGGLGIHMGGLTFVPTDNTNCFVSYQNTGGPANIAGDLVYIPRSSTAARGSHQFYVANSAGVIGQTLRLLNDQTAVAFGVWTFNKDLLIKDYANATKKPAFRNPTATVQTASYTLTQTAENQIIYFNAGAPAGQTFTLPTLETFTSVRIINRSSNSLALAPSGVTLEWLKGGELATGPRVLASGSVCDLYWINANQIEVFGNGLS